MGKSKKFIKTVDEKKIKSAYKKLYLKSIDLDIPYEQRAEMLEKVVQEKLLKSFSKQYNENDNLSYYGTKELFQELKELMEKWNKEFDMQKKWWRFWQ